MNNLTKHCKRCDTTKSLDDFHKDSKSSDGKYSYCKECNKAKAKAAYRADPEGRREYERKRRERFPDRDREQNYKSKYGITLAQYNEMHAAQGGVQFGCFPAACALLYSVRAGAIALMIALVRVPSDGWLDRNSGGWLPLVASAMFFQR